MSSVKDDKIVLPSVATDFMAELRATLNDAPPEYLEVLAPTIKQFIGLVQLATLGNSKSVAELLDKPGNFMQNLIDGDKGALMGYIQARALHQVMTTDSTKDPLDWAKLMVDAQKANNVKGKTDGDGTPRKAEEAEYQLISELDEERKKVPKAKSRKKRS